MRNVRERQGANSQNGREPLRGSFCRGLPAKGANVRYPKVASFSGSPEICSSTSQELRSAPSPHVNALQEYISENTILGAVKLVAFRTRFPLPYSVDNLSDRLMRDP
jgi:hypothetical protein